LFYFVKSETGRTIRLEGTPVYPRRFFAVHALLAVGAAGLPHGRGAALPDFVMAGAVALGLRVLLAASALRIAGSRASTKPSPGRWPKRRNAIARC
jgi:hypothetical protein